jgi:hypothetical protein
MVPESEPELEPKPKSKREPFGTEHQTKFRSTAYQICAYPNPVRNYALFQCLSRKVDTVTVNISDSNVSNRRE